MIKQVIHNYLQAMYSSVSLSIFQKILSISLEWFFFSVYIIQLIIPYFVQNTNHKSISMSFLKFCLIARISRQVFFYGFEFTVILIKITMEFYYKFTFVAKLVLILKISKISKNQHKCTKINVHFISLHLFNKLKNMIFFFNQKQTHRILGEPLYGTNLSKYSVYLYE